MSDVPPLKYVDCSQKRQLLAWLRENYEDAKQAGQQLFCWCYDTKREEEICLAPSGLTLEQVRDDIEKKKMPLVIRRVFTTALAFNLQISDL